MDLTYFDRRDLINGATIKSGKASLKVEWVSLPGIAGLGAGAMPKEARFVMRGPSGVHSLLVEATDAQRLNAHWTIFAADERNACAA